MFTETIVLYRSFKCLAETLSLCIQIETKLQLIEINTIPVYEDYQMS